MWMVHRVVQSTISQPYLAPWVASNELEEHVNTSQKAQKYKSEGMDFCGHPG